jgi:predicted ATPase
MHLKKIIIDHEKYPVKERYPFNLKVFQGTREMEFHSPVTLFMGENGTGKSTLLRALSHKCQIHIWKYDKTRRHEFNPYEESLYEALSVCWSDGPVAGSFFSSQTFQDFTQILEEWASASSGVLDYFGGKSLMTQSHGQSIMSYFRSRYKIKGLYLMDEPETALSPKSQLELLRVIKATGESGDAQFIIATHSPIILSCPEAQIFSFDSVPIEKIVYEETEHYRIYRDFMTDRRRFFL